MSNARANWCACAGPATVEAAAEIASAAAGTGGRGAPADSTRTTACALVLLHHLAADKNVADSLQRLPGVYTATAGGTEGGFGENDRVSVRGAPSALALTTLNGHSVSSGHWYSLNIASGGRSVSYSLLPSELVSRVEVRKSSEASLVEGGTAGSVNIITRKPLEFSKALTFEAGVGAVYASLPKKTDPQLNALLNWRDDSKTFGVLVQATVDFFDEAVMDEPGDVFDSYYKDKMFVNWRQAETWVLDAADQNRRRLLSACNFSRSGTRNCRSTSRPRAPTANRIPISRVRSVTLTSMMFMTPMPPTMSAIDEMSIMSATMPPVIV